MESKRSLRKGRFPFLRDSSWVGWLVAFGSFALLLLAVNIPVYGAGNNPEEESQRSQNLISIEKQAWLLQEPSAGAEPQEQAAGTMFLPIVEKTRGWSTCTASDFGTMLINFSEEDWTSPAEVLIYANDQLGIKGMAATGAPSDSVRDEWFGRLPDWRRAFIRGKYEQLETIHETATVFDMQDMYECISYGPESPHGAGEEALDPLTWVPKAEEIAEEAGKCLIYGPAVRDYERLSTPAGDNEPNEELLANLISGVAPHVDVWMVQLAKYQLFADGGHDGEGNDFTMEDFINWIGWWVDQVKTANPQAEVWTQLGIGVFDPLQKACLPPQPPEYLLEYREALIKAGVAGIFVMPSQSCQLSEDPQDHEYYLQSLDVFKQAMELACGGW